MTSPDCTTPTKRCPKCGETKPSTDFHRNKRTKDRLGCYCKLCQRLCDRAWREKNPERARQSDCEKSARYREAHPEKVRAAQSAFNAKRRDAMRAYARNRYWANPEKGREIQRLWRAANPEKAKLSTKNWHAKNPDKWREAHQNRKARKLSAGGTHTAADIRAQLKRQKGRCYWCGEKVTEYHIDHVIPLSRGGSNDPANLVISCPACNMSKKDKLPHEWKGSGGRMF